MAKTVNCEACSCPVAEDDVIRCDACEIPFCSDCAAAYMDDSQTCGACLDEGEVEEW